MADNKKYYWFKMQEDFFRQPRIKKLRRIAGGDTYTIIYLEMQLLSLRNNGVLIFEGIEDNFIEELALTLDEDVENVKVTVMYLMNQGLIEEIKPDEYAMFETMKNIGSESAAAERVRKHREKKALQSNNLVTIGNTEKEIEKDKEIEGEIEGEKKKETYVSVIDSYTTDPSIRSALLDYVEMRKKTKGFTIKALKLNLNTLDKLTDEPDEMLEIINKSVEHSWKGFYPLKPDDKKNLRNRVVPMPSYMSRQSEPEPEVSPVERIIMNYKNELIMLKLYPGDEEITSRLENYKSMYRDLTGQELEESEDIK